MMSSLPEFHARRLIASRCGEMIVGERSAQAARANMPGHGLGRNVIASAAPSERREVEQRAVGSGRALRRGGRSLGASGGRKKRSRSSTRPCGSRPILPTPFAWAATCSASSARANRRCGSTGARSSSIPLLVVARVNAGKLLFQAGGFAEALDCFETATRLAPDDADAWCSAAGALRELGRLEELAAAARRALMLRGDLSEAAINLGNALLKLDRAEEALDAYRQRAPRARLG